MYLYLVLNLGSILIPLIYSFEKNFNFISHWKSVFLGIIIVALPFVIWDVIFTNMGIWGFNPSYNTGLKIINLPFEEILFFICIPYACIFTHYVLFHYFKNLKIPNSLVRYISISLNIGVLLLIISNPNKLYTLINGILFLILIGSSMFNAKNQLSRFYISFLVILVPFYFVNGILTGSFIEEEVVWYNTTAIFGIRWGTIPIEDVIYCFNLLYLNLLVIEKLKSKRLFGVKKLRL